MDEAIRGMDRMLKYSNMIVIYIVAINIISIYYGMMIIPIISVPIMLYVILMVKGMGGVVNDILYTTYDDSI